MPAFARIALRLLGVVLVLAGLACLVSIFWPGADQVAAAMGVACADGRRSPSHQCTSFDAAEVLWTGFWVLSIAGLVSLVLARPLDKGPLTIDFGRRFR